MTKEDDDDFSEEEEVNEEKDKFMKELYTFMEKRGTPIPDKLPQLGKRALDLHRLYKEVFRRGGFKATIDNKQWRDITSCYKVPKTCTSASHSLKIYYKKWIFPYEQVVVFGNEDPSTEEEIAKEKLQQQQHQRQQHQANIHRQATHPIFTANVTYPATPTLSARTPVANSMPVNAFTANLQPLDRSTLGAPNIIEKRSWQTMMGLPANSNLINYMSKRAKTSNEIKDVELMKQIQCSLDCGIPKHIDWALGRLTMLTSTIPAPNQELGFKLDLIPSILPTLSLALNEFLRQKVLRKSFEGLSNLFNNYNKEYRTSEERALVVLVLLRNASFVSHNQTLILNTHVPESSTPLLELLIMMLDAEYHIEWRTKILDILVNCAHLIKLASDTMCDSLVYRLSQCISDPESEQFKQMRTKSLQIFELFLNKEHRANNLKVLQEKLKLEKNRECLWTIIDLLKTPSPIHHIHEVPLDESDDESDNNANEEDIQLSDEEQSIDEDNENNSSSHEKQSETKSQPDLHSNSITAKSGPPKVSIQEITTYEELNEQELLCRARALNLLMKMITFSSLEFQKELVNTNMLVARLFQLIIWKSGLQSRMNAFTSNCYNMLSHPHRHRHIENGDKVVTDEESGEDFDQDELFDDYGDNIILSMACAGYDLQQLSNAQIFQKKCAFILHQLVRHSRAAANDPNAGHILKAIELHEHELAYLLMLVSPVVSQQLSHCIIYE